MERNREIENIEGSRLSSEFIPYPVQKGRVGQRGVSFCGILGLSYHHRLNF